MEAYLSPYRKRLHQRQACQYLFQKWMNLNLLQRKRKGLFCKEKLMREALFFREKVAGKDWVWDFHATYGVRLD
ncbi:hypothetical protein JV46_24460 [Solemya velum gill symbiont]|uniref:Transposase n=1 Tax=Solemya velum gill symbiont TaxID=2340 RepID=A0A0B0H565_SOVGS|nr:hypothetical protein JV46_24460 [Solemya velum gill symbiont]